MSYALCQFNLQEITMPSVINHHFIQTVVHSLFRTLTPTDITPSQFTFTFLRHIAERKGDVAKETGLIFQLARFQKQLKPRLQQMHF